MVYLCLYYLELDGPSLPPCLPPPLPTCLPHYCPHWPPFPSHHTLPPPHPFYPTPQPPPCDDSVVFGRNSLCVPSLHACVPLLGGGRGSPSLPLIPQPSCHFPMPSSTSISATVVVWRVGDQAFLLPCYFPMWRTFPNYLTYHGILNIVPILVCVCVVLTLYRPCLCCVFVFCLFVLFGEPSSMPPCPCIPILLPTPFFGVHFLPCHVLCVVFCAVLLLLPATQCDRLWCHGVC